MLKKILAALAMSYFAAISFAATDANKATAAELDAVKGIGPAVSARIIEQRKHGEFKDWPDFISRVKGIGQKNAAHLSDNGLTINGASFQVTAPAKADKKAQGEEKAEKTGKGGKGGKDSGKPADTTKPAASMAK